MPRPGDDAQPRPESYWCLRHPHPSASHRIPPAHPPLASPLPPRPPSCRPAEGALTQQKDVKLEKHHILNLPNLHVAMALKSLKSMGHVREVFNWQWHYYFLTDSGVEYLREYLHLPEEVIPATLKKAAVKTLSGAPAGERRFGDRDAKGGAPGGEFRPRFGGREGGAPREGGYRREGGFGGAAGGAPRQA